MIDFTGWACVNCRKMEENVDATQSARLHQNNFILVSLYVDDRGVLPVNERFTYSTKTGDQKIFTRLVINGQLSRPKILARLPSHYMHSSITMKHC